MPLDENKNHHHFLHFTILLSFLLSPTGFTQQAQLPCYLKTGLLDLEQPESLGLSVADGAETFTIFKSNENTDHYCNGVVLFPFKGMLYAQWQSSAADEDAEDTWVAYSRSSDGKTWTEPMVLVPKWSKGIRTSGGWRATEDTLVAFLNVWPDSLNDPKGGYTECLTSANGLAWSSLRMVMNDDGLPVRGVFEQDPHILPNGRLIGAFHEQPGLMLSPYFTDDPMGISGWKKGRLNHMNFDGNMSREIEPSWFCRSDGAIVMLCRDQGSSFRKLASLSDDVGETWTMPGVTNIPDCRAKQSAGNLPDGTAYLVGCPSGNKNRWPLVILLSRDGFCFDRAYLLRSGGGDLPPLRYEGKYKRIGYHYPKSVIWKDYLYIGYATNKEDVEITRVPLSSLLISDCVRIQIP